MMLSRSSPNHRIEFSRQEEQASSVIEYVGLGALATIIVSGLAATLDSDLGNRFGSVIVRHLLEVISGS